MTKCGTCGKQIDYGFWPWCPHEPVFNTRAQRFNPVVYFEDSKGNRRFPGRADSHTPKGFERRELNTIHAVRKFEKEMNRSERERWDRHKIREEMTFEPMKKQLRSELVNQMQSFSNLGKDFARLAMKKNDEKRRGDYDAGFRLEIFS